MAAPTPTARQTPLGIWTPTGFRTKITFFHNPNISLWEVAVKPAGTTNGEPIPQDTMWNTRRNIKRPQPLIDGTPAQITFQYDPQLQSQIDALCGVETTITEAYYDGGTKAYYGYLQTVEFDPLERGQPGKGTATIIQTNWDYVNRVEAGPVWATVAGS